MAATYTITAVLNRALRRYGDLQRPVALEYLQEAHDLILRTCVMVRSSSDIVLVAGTTTYPVSSFSQVFEADLLDPNGVPTRQLQPIYERDLEKNRRRFRGLGPGTPTYFYRTYGSDGTVSVGLFLPPDATAVSLYPTLRLYGNLPQTVSETPGSGVVTQLPQAVDTPMPWVHYVRWQWAADQHKEDAQEHQMAFWRSLNDLRARVGGYLPDLAPRNDPFFRQAAWVR